MAGRGPAPKPGSQRRTHHAPQRGDWVDLAPLEKPVLPALPRGRWSARTKSAWAAWRQDPATRMYGPAEVQSAVDLAYLYEEWVDRGGSKIAAEIRQRQDGLGLSPKGKQDRRWRVAPAEVEQPKLASVTPIRLDPHGLNVQQS